MIAVDVVLLPDTQTVEQVLRINEDLIDRAQSEIRLHAERCLPHVSLAMGCLEPTALDALVTDLTQVVANHPLGPCPCNGLVTRISSSSGLTVSSLELTPTPPLQALHEAVLQACSPYLSNQVQEDMLHGEKPIAPSTLEWIRTYRERSSFTHFWPHITLGYGDATGHEVPTEIHPHSLAVCHLGNHCTCRKVLAEVAV